MALAAAEAHRLHRQTVLGLLLLLGGRLPQRRRRASEASRVATRRATCEARVDVLAVAEEPGLAARAGALEAVGVPQLGGASARRRAQLHVGVAELLPRVDRSEGSDLQRPVSQSSHDSCLAA